MPFKSPAQARLMRARAHGWKPDRIKGPSVKVAKEFVAADKKAKGMQVGGLFSAKKLRKMRRKQDPDYDPYARYGTEPLTLKQASRRVSSKTKRGAEVLTAKREMTKAGWTESGGKWYPPQATLGAPTEGGLAAATEPERTIQPIEGREFIASAAPPRRRAPEDIAPGFRPGRVPPSLVAYLERARAAAGEEPVKMQFGGAMRGMMQRGRRGRRGFGGRRGQPQPPGGGGLARAAVQPGGGMMTSDMGMRRGPGGVGQGQPRPQPPGGGVPMRGVGRPPGMGGPGAGGSRLGDVARRGMPPGAGGGQPYPQAMPANRDAQRRMMERRGITAPTGPQEVKGSQQPGRGGGASDYQSFLQQRKQQATAPGAGGGVRAAVMPGRGFMPGGGGAGMPGAAPRIGMGDQQGAQARAMQVQTGRPPMSRRMGFPGRGRRRRGRFG